MYRGLPLVENMFTIKNENRSDHSEVLQKNYVNQVFWESLVQSGRPEGMEVDGPTFESI